LFASVLRDDALFVVTVCFLLVSPEFLGVSNPCHRVVANDQWSTFVFAVHDPVSVRGESDNVTMDSLSHAIINTKPHFRAERDDVEVADHRSPLLLHLLFSCHLLSLCTSHVMAWTWCGISPA